MSLNALEKLLWKVSSSPEEARRLGEEFEACIAGYSLDESERARLQSWDVRALADLGVNPLLLMMSYAAVNGFEKTGEYIGKINTPAGGTPAG